MTRPRLTAGDTFLVNGIYRDANGDAVDLRDAGIVITAAARSADGKFTYDLTVEIKDQDETPGGYTLVGDTSDWQPGDWLAFQVRFTQGAVSRSTRPYGFDLAARIA